MVPPMRMNRGWMAVLALVVAAGPARAGEAESWLQVLPRDELRLLLGVPSSRVLVAAAGAVASDARPAAVALHELLVELAAPLVLDDAALGALDGLDDAAIVTRCAGLPMDRVAVVRLQAGRAADDRVAVVAVYAADGKRLGSVVADLRASRVTLQLSPEEAAKRSARRAEFDRRRLDFEWWRQVDRDTGKVVEERPEFYLGRPRQRIEEGELLERLGRAEDAQRHRATLERNGSRNLGAVALVAGGVLAGSLIWGTGSEGPFGAATGLVSIGLILGSLVGAGVVSQSEDVHPVPLEEVRELIGAHNAALSEELGLRE